MGIWELKINDTALSVNNLPEMLFPQVSPWLFALNMSFRWLLKYKFLSKGSPCSLIENLSHPPKPNPFFLLFSFLLNYYHLSYFTYWSYLLRLTLEYKIHIRYICLFLFFGSVVQALRIIPNT